MERIAELRQGQHACLVYDDVAAAIAAATPFAITGLREGERVVWVLGEHDPAAVRMALSLAGVSVAAEEARGALVLVDQWTVSFPDGAFDPAAMIAYVRGAIGDALAASFRGVRVVAEMTWALQMGVGHNKLIHYEALGNHLYPAEPLVALCMYDRRRFPVAVCHDAMRVHPVVATEEGLAENAFFEPPAALFDEQMARERLEQMLSQLARLKEAERQRAELAKANAARAAAEAAVQAKDDLLALLAHELRGPVQATVSWLQVARRTLSASGASEQTQHALVRAERQAQRQARLISDVLDAARLASEELRVERRCCDLAQILGDFGLDMERQGHGRRLALNSVPRAQVLADPTRIEQVLRNLIDNAMKFSPEESAIDVTLRQAGDYYELVVRDRGPGIPSGEHERIFQKYYRGDGAKPGLGLGLHLSRAIALRHGGELFAQDAADGGAIFILRLPRLATTSQMGPPQAGARDGERVAP